MFMRKLIYTAKSIMLKPKWLIVFVLGRFQTIRLIYRVVSKINLSSKGQSTHRIIYRSPSLFADYDTDQIINYLNKDGVFAGFSLPESITQCLIQYAHSSDCFPGGITSLGCQISEKEKIDELYDRPFYTARYFNVSTSCPVILELANDPVVQEIATQYIGGRAKYTGASLFWSFPVKGASHDSDQQHFSKFHYDIDDYISLRFCFYLTEVTSESGPHICIRGSNRKRSILHSCNPFSRIQSEKRLAKYYGPEKFMTLKGKPGYGFIEDTYCFHRGEIPKICPRLFLQLHFSPNSFGNANYHDYREPNTLQSIRQKSFSKSIE